MKTRRAPCKQEGHHVSKTGTSEQKSRLHDLRKAAQTEMGRSADEDILLQRLNRRGAPKLSRVGKVKRESMTFIHWEVASSYRCLPEAYSMLNWSEVTRAQSADDHATTSARNMSDTRSSQDPHPTHGAIATAAPWPMASWSDRNVRSTGPRAG